MGNYKCICGKEYESKNALNTHQKKHCKLLLSPEKYEYERNHCYKMSLRSGEISKKKAEIRRKEAEELWLRQQNKCEKCGKLMTIKYGSGRFCSRACANSRHQSDEIIRKISNSIKTSQKFIDSLLLRPRTTKVISGRYKGVFCASTWELAYYVYCIDHNIKIERCKRTFDYKYNNEIHKYLPDWYLPHSDTYVEIKGYNCFYDSKVVESKINAIKLLNINYEFIDDDSIDPYIDYCKETYGIKNLKYLYDDVDKVTKSSRKHIPRTAGYKWYNNGLVNTLIKESSVSLYESNGWKRGKITKLK